MKRYCLISSDAETSDFASLTEAFSIGAKLPGAPMIFDNQAKTGKIEAWVLRDGKWCACEIAGDDSLPDRILWGEER